MKSAFFLAVLTAMTLNCLAQKKVKPEYDKETNQATVDGEFYINIEKKDSRLVTASDWWITNEDGALIIQFLSEQYSYYDYEDRSNKTAYRVKIFFPESGSYFFHGSTPLGMGAKSVLKKLAKNELIKDGDLDWEMARALIQSSDGYLLEPKPSEKKDPIYVVDGDIFMGDDKIGFVKRTETDSEYTFNIYNVHGEKVVTAIVAIIDPEEWILESADGTKNSFLYNDDPDGHKLIAYLEKKGLLFAL
jgi:hypothetical protein